MTKEVFFIIAAIILASSSYAQTLEDIAHDVEKSKYGRNQKAGHYVNSRGFNMYYETYGKGSPLLLIHGNSGSIVNFIYQIPYFSRHYKVIVADSRAQGKSADPGDSLSYEMMADDYNALLDSLHLDSCYVVGWSDGGINGLLLAMRHPDKVKKLAVTGANLWPDTSAVDPFVFHWAGEFLDSLSRIDQTAEVKDVRKLFSLLVNEPHISLKQLQAIQCPTLVIGGDHDALLPKHTMLIAQSIPKSYLWIVPNSGHATPVRYKEQFNSVVHEFFVKPYRIIEGFDRLF